MEAQKDKADQSLSLVEKHIIVADHNIRRLQYNHGDPEQIDELKSCLQDLKSSRSDLIMMQDDLQSKISSLKSERYHKVGGKRHEALKKLTKLNKSSHPFVQFILTIYQNQEDLENLEHIFTGLENNNMRVYRINNFSFLLPETIALDFPYRTICVTEEGLIVDLENPQNYTNSIPLPLYGTSWFSKEAHITLSTLTTEYRKLAKQYHPDIYKEPHAEKIFSAILQEYKDLSSALKHF